MVASATVILLDEADFAGVKANRRAAHAPR
jgi:hypothetical protein